MSDERTWSEAMAYVASRLRAEASSPRNIASMRLLVELALEFEAAAKSHAKHEEG